MARKGTQVPIRELYWNVGTLSVATLVSYRRPGHRRGSPHQAILPGRVECTELAEELLAAVVGEVEQVRILELIVRPGVFLPPPDVIPEPFVIPGLRGLANLPTGQPIKRSSDSDHAALARFPIPGGGGMRPELIDPNQLCRI